MYPCFQVFTSIFAFECIIKLMALSKDFFLCGWNIFDLIIVSASLVDIIFELVDGLSVLRGLRLVSRIFSSCEHNYCNKIRVPIHQYNCSFYLVAGVEVGSIVDNNESASQYNHFDDRCPWKSNAHSSDSHLHICRYRYAIVLERLHTR